MIDWWGSYEEDQTDHRDVSERGCCRVVRVPAKALSYIFPFGS